jgi:hypothetical protein
VLGDSRHLEFFLAFKPPIEPKASYACGPVVSRVRLLPCFELRHFCFKFGFFDPLAWTAMSHRMDGVEPVKRH